MLPLSIYNILVQDSPLLPNTIYVSNSKLVLSLPSSSFSYFFFFYQIHSPILFPYLLDLIKGYISTTQHIISYMLQFSSIYIGFHFFFGQDFYTKKNNKGFSFCFNLVLFSRKELLHLHSFSLVRSF